MNYSGWKKISDGENSAVFCNKEGHKLTVAKKRLSKKLLGELSSLPLHKADGGEVNVDEMLNDQMKFKQGLLREPTGAPQEETPQQSTEPAAETPPQPQEGSSLPQWSPQAARQQSLQQPQQQAQTQQAAAVATPEQQYQQSYQNTVAQTAQARGKEDALWAQDLANGHVTPKTYADLFENKSTLGKIGTVFGLLMSGAGSGLAHQTNAALEMMNNEIKNDLDAQKTSKTNAMNYFKANLEHQRTKAEVGLHNAQTEHYQIQNSYDKALNQARIAAVHDLYNMSNKLPPDKGAQMKQVLDTQVMPAVVKQNEKDNLVSAEREVQFRQRMDVLRKQERLGVLPGGFEQAKVEEDRHIQDFGPANASVPSDVRQNLSAKRDFDKAAKEYIKFAEENRKNWAKLDVAERKRVSEVGITMGRELQAAYKNAIGASVAMAEQKLIDDVIPANPVDMFARIKQIPKLEQLVEDNKRKTESVAGGYGMTIPEDMGLTLYTTKGEPYVMKNGKAVFK